MRKTILLVIMSLLISSCSKRAPQQQPSVAASQATQLPTGPVPQFDPETAFDFLVQQVKFGPRVPNSDAHEECLNYLTQKLGLYADSVHLQKFDVPGYDGTALHLANIIANFNLKAKTRVLLTAHWDSRPRADHEPGGAVDKPIPAADDGASGVAVLLEMARDFKESPPPIGVDIILWDGEDYGKESELNYYCLGSKYWAATRQSSYYPIFAVNLDMIGQKGLQITKEGYSVEYAPDIVNLIWNTASELGVTQFIDRVGDPIYDDQLPLDNIGLKAVDLIDFNYKYWHTLEDTPDKCSPESLAAVGKVLIQVIYRKIPVPVS